MIDTWLAPLNRLANAVQRGTLSNGLPWILLPNQHASVTSLQVWFRRGSCDDPEGHDGTAHFLEHMMFRGSQNIPDGLFDQRAERHGIEANAMTWFDYTAYLYDGPASALDVMLQLEVDRLAHPTLSDAVVEEEREIILNERATHVDSDPDAMIDEFIAQQLDPTHPYRRPVLGTQESIRRIERDNLAQLQSVMRDPRELYVVAVGKFVPDALRDQLEATFGRLPAQHSATEPAPARQPLRWEDYELPERLRYSDPDIAEPRVIANLKSPGQSERDAPVVTLLGGLLDRGPYGILEEVFEDGKPGCVSANLDVQLHRHSSVGSILLIPADDDATEELADTLHDRLLERIHALEEREVEEARQRLALRALNGIDHTAILAESLATHELYQPSDARPFRILEEAVRTTRSELVDFAERWLSKDSRSLVIALPGEDSV